MEHFARKERRNARGATGARMARLADGEQGLTDPLPTCILAAGSDSPGDTLSELHRHISFLQKVTPAHQPNYQHTQQVLSRIQRILVEDRVEAYATNLRSTREQQAAASSPTLAARSTSPHPMDPPLTHSLAATRDITTPTEPQGKPLTLAISSPAAPPASVVIEEQGQQQQGSEMQQGLISTPGISTADTHQRKGRSFNKMPRSEVAKRKKRKRGQFASARADEEVGDCDEGSRGSKGKQEAGSANAGPPRGEAVCMHCRIRETQTPMMRRGPQGPKTLCNACGLRWSSKGTLPDLNRNPGPSSLSLSTPEDITPNGIQVKQQHLPLKGQMGSPHDGGISPRSTSNATIPLLAGKEKKRSSRGRK